MISLCASLCVCPLLWCFGCPLLVLHCLVPPRLPPLIVLVSPSPCLHSRSRLSASSSSNSSWPPREVQGPLRWCWAPGPQFPLARAREAWSSQASSELAAVRPPWSVSPQVLKTWRKEYLNSQTLFCLNWSEIFQSSVQGQSEMNARFLKIIYWKPSFERAFRCMNWNISFSGYLVVIICCTMEATAYLSPRYKFPVSSRYN